ncbi:MAG: hypothetical protein EAX96_07915 [Candidatus Lokiarchaeota archaeon]|nr:hypothetical protein [Candidatus Lokiarchaeota archaeon]
MPSIEELEENIKIDIEKLVAALKTELRDKESLSTAFQKKTHDLKSHYEEKIKNLELKNQELHDQIKILEENLKLSINISDKVSEFIKVTELKKISQEATKLASIVFGQLINEELKIILKLADSFSKRREKDHIDKESLNYALKQLIGSERLLKKAIELVHNLNF